MQNAIVYVDDNSDDLFLLARAIVRRWVQTEVIKIPGAAAAIDFFNSTPAVLRRRPLVVLAFGALGKRSLLWLKWAESLPERVRPPSVALLGSANERQQEAVMQAGASAWLAKKTDLSETAADLVELAEEKGWLCAGEPAGGAKLSRLVL